MPHLSLLDGIYIVTSVTFFGFFCMKSDSNYFFMTFFILVAFIVEVFNVNMNNT